ncbi:MAG: YlmC/YmxH family sporulation protein [Clostridia bacterium]|nr:YlmC/YmxH family sporulation protein [Clostridia bacterium]
MRQMTTASLCKKEIINLCDGRRLGFATEISFDPKCATVLSLMIPQSKGFLAFGRTEYLFIPWCKIECFGDDTILVRLTEQEICSMVMPDPGEREEKRDNCK